jgi:hypothetical protein
MNIRNLVMTAMAVALVGNFPVAYAQPGPTGPGTQGDESTDRSKKPQGHHAGKQRQKTNRIFRAADLDGSDTITLDEWLVKTAKKAEQRVDRMGADGDSQISLEEFMAEGNRRRPDFEVDHDALSACVAGATGADLPERPDRTTVFSQIDANDDGFINADELLASMIEKATDRFNATDVDDNGAITKQEVTTALKQQRERKRVHRDCVQDQREAVELIG